MPGVGQEAPGIRQHPYEAGEVAQVRQGYQLFPHADFVVVEPPCAALLDLGHGAGVLEAADDGADGLVVVGVQAVKDGPGQLVRLAQGIQEIRHLGGRGVIVDAVVTGVGAQFLVHSGIVVPLAAEVELHGPVQPMVLPAHEEHEGCLELHFFLSGGNHAVHALQKYGFNLVVAGRLVHHIFQSMVRHFAAHGVEKLHAFLQSGL